VLAEPEETELERIPLFGRGVFFFSGVPPSSAETEWREIRSEDAIATIARDRKRERKQERTKPVVFENISLLLISPVGKISTQN
jgi:hypothetical protein